MADGFLGRWSRRKLDVKEGRAVEEPVTPDPPKAVIPAQAGTQSALDPGVRGDDMVSPEEEKTEQPPLTLEDAKLLTPESDFKPFMAGNVSPEVKNAAMKKLFSDPHYNVMDRLDTYIDDYSKPDPIPAAMLRQLASAKFLKLFDDEEKDEEEKKRAALESPASLEGRDDADRPAAQDMAQSGLCNDMPSQLDSPALPASRTDHDDPDLRLQPDHAATGQKPGDGA